MRLKTACFVAILLVASQMFAQEYKFGYICAADDDILEQKLCESIRVSMLNTGKITSKSQSDLDFWGMLVIPTQHNDNRAVSAAINIQYIDHRCSPLVISVYNLVIVVQEDDLYPKYFDDMSKIIMDDVERWKNSVYHNVPNVCRQHKYLTAGGFDD